MKYYRVVYVGNKIISCRETLERIIGEQPYYEHNNGHLSFAVIRADNESQARSIAKYLAIEMIRQYQSGEWENNKKISTQLSDNEKATSQ